MHLRKVWQLKSNSSRIGIRVTARWNCHHRTKTLMTFWRRLHGYLNKIMMSIRGEWMDFNLVYLLSSGVLYYEK